MTGTTSAQAHGDESHEGYVLVQQALAHLAHGTSDDALDAAMEKVDDALAADDHDGVDLAEVREGRRALESGDVDAARSLLLASIDAALADLPLATGYETGTTAVPPTLPGRPPLQSSGWLVLALSAAVAGAGVWLSVRFRPREGVGALRLLMGAPPSRISRHQP